MTNRYTGTCHACHNTVEAAQGILERIGRSWRVWCQDCFNASDHSGAEDRCCGDRAYEDACARATGCAGY